MINNNHIKFTKIVDHKDLIRDMDSKAVLNTDTQKLNDYRNKKKMLLNSINNGDRITNLETQVSDLNSKIDKIVELLQSKG